MRIGVYVCECGINIAATVDVEKVAKAAESLPGVKISRYYKYMCSDPGQDMIKKDIKELKLDRVVVASCSPLMHEPTFRTACEEAGLNKYCFEMANIREQCSWVHKDKEKGTEKALAIVRASVAKAALLQAMDEKQVPVTKKAMVIGGGIAGIQTALDIADMGFPVTLVEREPSVGGHMAQLDKTFPTLDCSACILTPKMVDVGRHPNIELLTFAEVEEIDGFVGNFNVKVRKKAKSIDTEKCTSCGECMINCLVRYLPQPQEVPSIRDSIDEDTLKKYDAVISKHEGGALIPVLQDINATFNYLPADALACVAEKLELPLSQVFHVATFYTAFSLEPRGEHLIKVCLGTACHVRGGHGVLDEIVRQLGIQPGETTEDKKFTLETVNCLGCCALGPVVVIDDQYYPTSPRKVGALLNEYRTTGGAGIKPVAPPEQTLEELTETGGGRI